MSITTPSNRPDRGSFREAQELARRRLERMQLKAALHRVRHPFEVDVVKIDRAIDNAWARRGEWLDAE